MAGKILQQQQSITPRKRKDQIGCKTEHVDIPPKKLLRMDERGTSAAPGLNCDQRPLPASCFKRPPSLVAEKKKSVQLPDDKQIIGSEKNAVDSEPVARNKNKKKRRRRKRDVGRNHNDNDEDEDEDDGPAERISKRIKRQQLKLFQSENLADMMAWLIHPIPTQQFFDEKWEKEPLVVKRSQPDYYNLANIFSKSHLKKIMRKKPEIVNDQNFTICRFTDRKKISEKLVSKDNDFDDFDEFASNSSKIKSSRSTRKKPSIVSTPESSTMLVAEQKLPTHIKFESSEDEKEESHEDCGLLQKKDKKAVSASQREHTPCNRKDNGSQIAQAIGTDTDEKDYEEDDDEDGNEDEEEDDDGEEAIDSRVKPQQVLEKRVWDLYNQGNTLQVFQPQRWAQSLWKLIYSLEKNFGCLVGCNSYLTPPGAQGLAPHWDDVDVFVLQLEGRKTWCFHMLPEDQSLPYYHSQDISFDDLKSKPDYEFTLEAGDLMYMPRGVIHYAYCDSQQSSHHLTISLYQRNTWFDFLSVALPTALQSALHADLTFRQGLPINFLRYMGSAYRWDEKEISSEISSPGPKNSLNDDDDTDNMNPTTPKANGHSENHKSPQPSQTLNSGCHSLKVNNHNDNDVIDISNPLASRTELQNEFVKKMSSVLSNLPNHFDLHSAADCFLEDFMISRLPPPITDNLYHSIHDRYPESTDDFIAISDVSLVRMVLTPFSPQGESGSGSEDDQGVSDSSSAFLSSSSSTSSSSDDSDRESSTKKRDGKSVSHTTPRSNSSDDDSSSSSSSSSSSLDRVKNKKRTTNGNDNGSNLSHGKRKFLIPKLQSSFGGPGVINSAFNGFRVLLTSSLSNKRKHHMGKSTKPTTVELPSETAVAVAALFQAYPKPLRIRDLGPSFTLTHARKMHQALMIRVCKFSDVVSTLH